MTIGCCPRQEIAVAVCAGANRALATSLPWDRSSAYQRTRTSKSCSASLCLAARSPDAKITIANFIDDDLPLGSPSRLLPQPDGKEQAVAGPQHSLRPATTPPAPALRLGWTR